MSSGTKWLPASIEHTTDFTHRSLYADTFTHRRLYTEKLLHTEALTHRRFYTQKLLRTEPFTHRHFYTQNPLHTDTFTHRPFNRTNQIRQKKHQFFTLEPHFVRKSCRRHFKIAILPQFLTLEPHVVPKRLPPQMNRNFTSIFGDRTSKGCRQSAQVRNFTAVFDDRTSFRAKRLPPRMLNRNCTSVFDGGTAFRAKRLPPQGLETWRACHTGQGPQPTGTGSG